MSFASLNTKTALVTGATGGIGEAVARNLAAAGARVIVTGRNAEKLDKLAQELGGTAITANLAEEAARSLLLEQAGAVDILVNNAGLTRDGLLLRQSAEDWQEVLNVNLNAARDLAQGVLRQMSKNRWGRIVTITSVIGHTGNSGQTNYAAAKAALTAFSASLAQEVGRRGITVNCVAPGFIETAMTEALPEQVRTAYAARIPAGRFGTVQEVAAAVRFLASEEAAYINGSTVHVNGGLY